MKNGRNKGNSYERKLAKEFREMGFSVIIFWAFFPLSACKTESSERSRTFVMDCLILVSLSTTRILFVEFCNVTFKFWIVVLVG